MGKHLTYHQRVQLETLQKQGYSRSYMAKFLGMSDRTIYYELKRGRYERLNGDTWEMEPAYSADIAQADYKEKQSYKSRPLKLGKNWDFVAYIEQKIGKEKYSPRAALKEMQLEGLDFGLNVSHSTLYAWINSGYFFYIDNKSLPEGKRPRKKTGKAPQKGNYRHPLDKSINDRPREVESRQTFGHWEMDTVVGKSKGKSTCLLVLTERKTKMEIVRKMSNKTARETVRVLDQLQRAWHGHFKDVFKTITCDNGCEFADAKGIEKGGRTQVYYCHPYSSWERGQNENANRLVRRFIPKGQSMTRLTHKQVRYVENWMNHYPRQRLGWQRPIDLFRAELDLLQIPPPCTL